MPILTTPRLWLLPLSREVISRRLAADAFTLSVPGPDGPLEVRFGPDWPGDPLPGFPAKLRALEAGGAEELSASFYAVERAAREAVGAIGAKGQPDAHGDWEIGYGFAPSAQGRGYATEAVRALSAHLHGLPGVRRVTAQTAVWNRASERVLEKTGFTRTGTAWDAEDGDLTVWAQEDERC